MKINLNAKEKMDLYSILEAKESENKEFMNALLRPVPVPVEAEELEKIVQMVRSYNVTIFDDKELTKSSGELYLKLSPIAHEANR